MSEFHTEDWHALGRELEEQADRLLFLSQRSVPARCLTCFGHNIVELERVSDDDKKAVIHPGCGGYFIVEIEGGMNLTPATTKLIHRPDGTFLHEEPYEPPSLHFSGRFD